MISNIDAVLITTIIVALVGLTYISIVQLKKKTYYKIKVKNFIHLSGFSVVG